MWRKRLQQVARLLKVLIVVELVTFTVGILPGVRDTAGFNPVLDGWVQGSAYAVSGLICVLGMTRLRDRQRVWRWSVRRSSRGHWCSWSTWR